MEEIGKRPADEADQEHFREAQHELESSGVIPRPPTLVLRRHRKTLECIGGILFGVAIGSFALLLNFILFNLVLHLGS